MVRYSEIFLKSEPVKRRFLAVLTKNIGRALHAVLIDHTIELYRGRVLIHSSTPDTVIPVLSRIFGILDMSTVIVTGTSREELSRAAIFYAQTHLKPGMSFAIRARRDGILEYTSQELAASIGSDILTAFPDVTVDLTTPQYEIHVEARKEGGLVYDSRVAGPGGLPLGTQGNLISLLSAGIDSPVASWLMMKRGVTLTFLHIDGGTYGGNDIMRCSQSHLCQLSCWSSGTPLRMMVITGEPFFEALIKIKKARYRCLVCKAYMLALAGTLANDYGAEGMVTGDNVGQVASQTLANLSLLSSVTATPIFRPLIAYDKEEIIQRARKIGTFIAEPGDTSCHAVPKYPATQAECEELQACIHEMDFPRFISEAFAKKRMIVAQNGLIIE